MNVAPPLAYTWFMETPLTPAQVNVRAGELVDPKLISMLNEMLVEAYAARYFDMAQLDMGKVMSAAEELLPELDEPAVTLMISRASQVFRSQGWHVRVQDGNLEFSAEPFEDEDEDYE